MRKIVKILAKSKVFILFAAISYHIFRGDERCLAKIMAEISKTC